MSTEALEQYIPGSLKELIEVLQGIDISSPNSEINKTSIDDNNGGRIIL